MTCRYCGKPISMLRRLSDKEFCSAAHQKAYLQEQEELALARLLESRSGKSQPAPVSRRDNRTDIPSIVHDHTVLPEAFDPLSSLSHPDLNQALDTLLSQNGLDGSNYPSEANLAGNEGHGWPPSGSDHLSWTPAAPDSPAWAPAASDSPAWASAAPDQSAWDLIDESLERTQRLPSLEALSVPPARRNHDLPAALAAPLTPPASALHAPLTEHAVDQHLPAFDRLSAASAPAPVTDYRLPAPDLDYPPATFATLDSGMADSGLTSEPYAAAAPAAPVSDDPPFAPFTVDAPAINEVSDQRPLLNVEPIRSVPIDFVTPDTATHLVSMARVAAVVPVPLPEAHGPQPAAIHHLPVDPLGFLASLVDLPVSALHPEAVVVEEKLDVPDVFTELLAVAPPAVRPVAAPTQTLTVDVAVTLSAAPPAISFDTITLQLTSAAPPIVDQATPAETRRAVAPPAIVAQPAALTMLSLAVLGERLIDDVPGEQALVPLPALPPTRLTPVAIRVEAEVTPLSDALGQRPAVWTALDQQNFALDLLRLRASVGAVDLSPAIADIPSAPVLDPEQLESWAA